MDADLEPALLALRDALPVGFVVQRHRLPNGRWIAWTRSILGTHDELAGFGDTEAAAVRHLTVRLRERPGR